MSNNTRLLNDLKSYYHNEFITLPKDIFFLYNPGEKVQMFLNFSTVYSDNMQTESNAFEAWSLIIHAALNIDVYLDLTNVNFNNIENYSGHLARFYYRLNKFYDCYDWFKVSNDLFNKMKNFYSFLKQETLVNNFPTKDAVTNKKHTKENFIEGKLADKKVLKNYFKEKDLTNDIYRQLPVGLFKNVVSNKSMIFTGSKSAIDLWTFKDDEFILFELKTLNPMVGIITEIFFYSNFMYDLLMPDGLFTLNKNVKKYFRGYDNLVNNNFSKITGVMIADSFHSLITSDVINLLNKNFLGITYEKVSYDYNELVLKN